MKQSIQKKDILRLLRSKNSRPLTRQEMALHFGVSGKARNRFYDLLGGMEGRGEVVRVKDGRFAIPRELGLVVGRLEVNPRGFGFVRPEEGKGEDIYIHSEDMETALHGDTVLVRLRRERRRGRAGRVIRVLKRGREEIVGTLAEAGSLLHLVPDNPAFTHDIYVDRSRRGSARPGDKVTVAIVNWSSARLSPEGEVREVLGRSGDPAVDTISVIREYELPESFSSPARREAAAAARPISPEDRKGREDLRDMITFTIDPDAARDFDDAVSLTRSPDGNLELGVHISDVSHYVRPGTALDEAARERGTSVYFPARVLHMLPPELATAACSLRPAEEHLTLSAFLTFGPGGKRLGYRFAPSLIRSRRRFTYGEVRRIVVEREAAARRGDPELTEVLDRMASLASKLREKRFARGAIDLELPEEKIVFDEKGLIRAIELEGEDLAHRIVEEFMLAANEAAAEFLKERRAAFIYRVHGEPSLRDLKEFAEFVSAFGYRITNPRDRRQIQEFLDSAKETPLGSSLQVSYIRSLPQAVYSAENIGHFGLASTCYTYFTSPIRRYPDLHTHRVLKSVLRGKAPAGGREMEELARWCSQTERRGLQAERDMIRLRKLQFFRQQLQAKEKAVFQGVITGVKNFGLGVYLNRYLIGGLVHVSTLTDDFYRVDTSGTCLKGRRTKRRFRIGDVVRVRVENVDMVKKEVDFKIFPQGKI